ncbi:MAG: prepilin-type N-terminal cleavage/methylation domain-containing protein [Verrucomicrobia bacterium]|jgi:prepilin-type N-terminal cleavage/methylation domain-containing protein|nr:prepilin-type N-terminal cleavage/methylation domain-containing protein [Verrucomicrobiota bacterium]
MKTHGNRFRRAFSLIELLLALGLFSLVLGLVGGLLAAESRLRAAVETSARIAFLREKARTTLASGDDPVALAPDLSGTVLLFPGRDWLPPARGQSRSWHWVGGEGMNGGEWRILVEEGAWGGRNLLGHYEKFPE